MIHSRLKHSVSRRYKLTFLSEFIRIYGIDILLNKQICLMN